MQLHFSGDAGVIALAEVHAAPASARLHLSCDALAAGFVEAGRVADVINRDVVVDFVHFAGDDPVRDLVRRNRKPDVRLPVLAPIPFLVAVHSSGVIHRPPAAGERPCVAVVERHVSRPVRRNLERLDDVREPPVLVVLRVVRELHENLALEGIPVAVQQRPSQSVRLLLQLEDVILRDERVFCRQRRNVLRPDDPFLVQSLRVNPLFLNAHVRPGIHEHLLHPSMPDVARV